MKLCMMNAWMNDFRRSPCGERGLKYNADFIRMSVAQVAPRAGSVD